jgi:hypothetical protein
LAIHAVADVPERDLVRCLKTWIANPDALQAVAAHDQCFPFDQDAMHDLQESLLDCLLRITLSAPCSDQFLTAALKSLSVDDMAIVMQFVHDWLQRFRHYSAVSFDAQFEALEAKLAGQDGRQYFYKSRLSVDRALAVASSLIDTHPTQILLSSSLHSLVTEMLSTVEDQLDVCREMETMQGILDDCSHMRHALIKKVMKAKKRGIELNQAESMDPRTLSIGLYAIEQVQWW